MYGPYQTNPPSLDDIISSIRIDREGQVRRIRHEEEINVLEYQILTREIVPTLKPLEEIIQENIFCLGVMKISPPHLLRQQLLHLQLLQMHHQKLHPQIKPHQAKRTHPLLFQSKLQLSPSSLNVPTSPQPLNPLLDNISDVPPRPLNPQPLQSHPSLDITLSLSPITPLDHIHDTPSPPSPPQPQPPIMGHLLYYNCHGSTCICCSHNQTLFLTLRDEMNIMFAHL
ncbi:hypothetical protein Tco_1434215 [Tanacetum coccineum]